MCLLQARGRSLTYVTRYYLTSPIHEVLCPYLSDGTRSRRVAVGLGGTVERDGPGLLNRAEPRSSTLYRE